MGNFIQRCRLNRKKAAIIKFNRNLYIVHYWIYNWIIEKLWLQPVPVPFGWIDGIIAFKIRNILVPAKFGPRVGTTRGFHHALEAHLKFLLRICTTGPNIISMNVFREDKVLLFFGIYRNQKTRGIKCNVKVRTNMNVIGISPKAATANVPFVAVVFVVAVYGEAQQTLPPR